MVRDRISKPRKGRYFPYSAHEFRGLVADQKFSLFCGYPDNRISILLQNCETECSLGYQLCSFLRRTYIAQFSLPTVVSAEIARKSVDVTLAHFRNIDASPDLTLRDEQLVIYRAYLRSPGALTVTRHIINAGNRSDLYAYFRILAQLPKAQRNIKNQQTLFTAQISPRI